MWTTSPGASVLPKSASGPGFCSFLTAFAGFLVEEGLAALLATVVGLALAGCDDFSAGANAEARQKAAPSSMQPRAAERHPHASRPGLLAQRRKAARRSGCEDASGACRNAALRPYAGDDALNPHL